MEEFMPGMNSDSEYQAPKNRQILPDIKRELFGARTASYVIHDDDVKQ